MNVIQQTQQYIYEGYTGSFASFFQTGDPNAHKLTKASVPENWRTGEEFAIEADGFAELRVVQLNERCGFWRGVADDVPV